MGTRHLAWAVVFTTSKGELWFRVRSGSWAQHGSRDPIEGRGGQRSFRPPHAPPWCIRRDARRYTKRSAEAAYKNLKHYYDTVVRTTAAPEKLRRSGAFSSSDVLAIECRERLCVVDVEAPGVTVLADLAGVP